MIALQGGNYDALFILIMAIMLGPPLLLTIIGLFARKSNKHTAKVLFILSGLYLLIGLGFCGSMIA